MTRQALRPLAQGAAAACGPNHGWANKFVRESDVTGKLAWASAAAVPYACGCCTVGPRPTYDHAADEFAINIMQNKMGNTFQLMCACTKDSSAGYRLLFTVCIYGQVSRVSTGTFKLLIFTALQVMIETLLLLQ